MFRTFVMCLWLGSLGCTGPSRTTGSSPGTQPTPPRAPIALTYLGVAGWQLEAGGKTLISDPYLSRPADSSAPLVPDAAAIAAHTPARADLVFVG
ncbi:MAG: MBL fold metallo-hydrolase, partial [Myxococcales bacterium]|nr:MBL fold metallo-hydrolase [Myxococcales bacterium]